jgi:nitroreductase
MPTLTDTEPETAEHTVAELATRRRSIRKYTADPIPDADLREIIRIAGRAPSSLNVQPWRFVVVRDAALKQRLQVAANNQAQVGAAAADIVLYADIRDAIAHPEEFIDPSLEPEKRALSIERLRGRFNAMIEADRAAWAHAQGFIALGYLLLAAESLGYATSPMQGFDARAVKALLDLPGHVTIPAIVALGVPAEPGRVSTRHDVDRIATFR